MHIGITGHRPDKLGGYNIPNPTYLKVHDWLRAQLIQLEPRMVYTGMALGVDQWAAEICIELQIPFTPVIPFEGQEKVWPEASQRHYWDIMAHAATPIPVVTSEKYRRSAFQIRNVWVVNNCDLLLAVWDGTEGGTKNCVDYAEKQGRAIIRLNPKDFIL